MPPVLSRESLTIRQIYRILLRSDPTSPAGSSRRLWPIELFTARSAFYLECRITSERFLRWLDVFYFLGAQWAFDGHMRLLQAGLDD